MNIATRESWAIKKFSDKKSVEIPFLKKTLKEAVFFLFSLTFIVGFFLLNVYVSQKHNAQSWSNIINSFFSNTHDSSFDPVKKIIWVNLAAIVSGAALSIASSVSQSLTQNPLADSTTLGMGDASVFGIILLKIFFGSYFTGSTFHWAYMLFGFLGSMFVLMFLIYFMKRHHSQKFLIKIILFGLILNIFLRAIIQVLKTYHVNTVNAIYALTIGGPENTYELFANQYQVLRILAGVLFVIGLVSLSLSKKMNLAELGEEQSKSLGVNHKSWKFISFGILLFTTTISTTLCGNIAFVGLLSTHIVRLMFKTRKYQIILPMSSIVASIFFLLSVFLNIIFPKIPSSIFLLFFGSVVLCYLSIKN